MAVKKAVVKKTKAVAAKAKSKPTSKPKAVKAVAPKAKAETTTASIGKFKIVSGNTEAPRSRISAPAMYPFGEIAVGDEFFIATETDKSKYKGAEGDKAESEELKRISNRMTGASRRFTKQHDGYQFSVRIVRDGLARKFEQDIGVVIRRKA